MLGNKPKLSDKQIYDILGLTTLPMEGDYPPIAQSRPELVANLMERGMTRTPAIKRIEGLVRKGIIKMGPDPFGTRHDKVSPVYWVEPIADAAPADTKYVDPVLSALAAQLEPVGVRELMRRCGDRFGFSLATLQRRLEALGSAGLAARDAEGRWSAVKAGAATTSETIEIE